MSAWDYFAAHPWLTGAWWAGACFVWTLTMDELRSWRFRVEGRIAKVVEERMLAAAGRAVQAAVTAADLAKRGGSST